MVLYRVCACGAATAGGMVATGRMKKRTILLRHVSCWCVAAPLGTDGARDRWRARRRLPEFYVAFSGSWPLVANVVPPSSCAASVSHRIRQSGHYFPLISNWCKLSAIVGAEQTALSFWTFSGAYQSDVAQDRSSRLIQRLVNPMPGPGASPGLLMQCRQVS